ncbi:D-arabinono-1,4-lactone oxidase [Hoyosella subflava]|uniref:Putative oxidoreductase n=1 Tax=Hoyosella subflava (strain DSM 45089 / JCM 17490 / NBRC 109087 / DQS3-9A1) TaxID=443218 RepID=F6ERI1_HOYSD|nr:D-arabinono-1,4-lactone oxidase [Hoyosella subflava]AEF38501.1 putative oxidoreductase [Hoyosella subflava DQS3-9A1]
MAGTWQNWSGQVSCTPASVEYPESELAAAALITAKRDQGNVPVRPVGAGHSFNDLCATTGTLIDPGRMNRVLGIDTATGRVRVQAGITLRDLTESLASAGLALRHSGGAYDQQLGGSLATGTHGTGTTSASLSAQVRSVRLVTADGTVREAAAPASTSEDSDFFNAAVLGLGALGLVTEVELETVPAFRLHRVQTPRILDSLMPELLDRVAATDHTEIFLFPYTRRALLLEATRTDAPAQRENPLRLWFERDILESTALGSMLRIAATKPKVAPLVSQGIAALANSGERIDDSTKLSIPAARVRYTEMEYAIPIPRVIEAIERILAVIQVRRLPVASPIEVRFAAADTALLSPASGGPVAYVAVHQYVGLPWEDYFAAAESILLELGGRPHWGKRHSLTARDFAASVPGWDAFGRVRAHVDPDGIFSGEYLQRILGPVPSLPGGRP